MSTIQLIALALSAMLAENLVLVHSMGIGCRSTSFTDPKEGRRSGIALTLVMVVSGTLSRGIDQFLHLMGVEFLSLLIFSLLVPAVSVVLQVFLHFFLPELSLRLMNHLKAVSLNAAGLGAILLASQRSYSVGQTFIFTLFGGIGVTLVMMCFAGLREEVSFTSCPKSFRGAPILFITAGLMAMAMVGFYGLHIA